MQTNLSGKHFKYFSNETQIKYLIHYKITKNISVGRKMVGTDLKEWRAGNTGNGFLS